MRNREPLFQERPTVIGHRGFGAREVLGRRENTIASLTAAVDAGLSWVELDVHRCSDGLAMIHDPHAPDGGAVIGRSARDLRAGGVEDLAAALEALPTSVGVDIDLKSSLEDARAGSEHATAAVLAPLVDHEASRRPLLVTSFDPAALLELRERAPAVPLGLLTWFGFPPRIAVAAAARLDMDVLGLQVGSLGQLDPVHGSFVLRPDAPQVLDAAHAAGLQVLAWCPDAAVTPLLAAAGVDAVVVDDVPAQSGTTPRT